MKTKRPGIITAVCIVGFLGALVTAGLIYSIVAYPSISEVITKQFGTWYLVFLVISLGAGIISMIGLWMMKKWGVIVYTVFAVLGQVVVVVTGQWNISSLVIPLIVVVIGLSKYKLMD